ncbi:enoyl-CoA hydratase/isomerase family protein [Oxalobacteraceae bacterium CAVE-383]|nr:enoyl-CoA hydratase/isomerase family protein [Oxalobacteraceae bacterium CAVE-383]
MNELIASKKGEVGYLRFNMPETGNKIAHALIARITEELLALGNDTAIKAIVISSEGDHFCQGRDAGKKDPSAPAPTAVDLRNNMMKPIIGMYQALRDIQIPIVAVVQGEAHGFGAALAGSCDITIAADDAKFSFPELKANMPPTLAMAAVLDRVPLKTLGWLVYTSNVINAHEAQRAGLVSTVAPRADLQRTADEVIATLVSKEREALIGVKQFLGTTQNAGFNEAAALGTSLLAGILASAGK